MKRLLSLAFCLLVSFSLHAQPRPGPGKQVRFAGNFGVTVPDRWQTGPQTRTSLELFIPLQRERPQIRVDDKNPKPFYVITSEIGMLITIEERRDHEEALRRLAEIAAEQPVRYTPLIIAGWPAIERRYRDLMPQPGQEQSRGNLVTWFTTTAIAAGTTLVRFDSMLAPDADQKLLDEALAIARTFSGRTREGGDSQRELDELSRRAPPAPPSATPPAASRPAADRRPRPGDGGAAGVAIRVQQGVGELEIAASNDGLNVVVAANSGFSFSANSGANWMFGGPTPCNQVVCDGDPSLAVGQTGAMYYAWIGGPAVTQLGNGISRSTDNGQTFPFASMAVQCPGASNCQVADQEHIAADRVNAGAMGDRVYNVWRNFPLMGGMFSLRIVCSGDNAANWGAQQVIGAGDFPRVAVGRDGFVYVAWASGGNMMLHKYSNCDAGLAAQAGFPVVVSAFTNVVCPVPGLDRCNGRNILSSPVVAVDDLDAAHVYYSFTTSTGAGNENVMVFDSTDGGLTFPRNVVVNTAVAAKRFMSWISTYGGTAVLSWYDRRTATMANNDRTRFFIGSASVKGPSLVAGPELDLSGVDDAQCSNWPCATNATTDSESCSAQPQLAGRCSGSFAPCDFSTGPCPVGQTCNIGRGCPKYGDYNGNAATAGRHFSAWASFIPPAGIIGAPAGINVYTSTDLIPSDFYVRDWTTNATTFDNGAQPSTNPWFWATSDIWNQQTNVAAPFPGVDWILGDPPTRSGSNFMFARVSRRAPAASTAGPTNVNVEFFQADYGLGVPYSSAGTEMVTFNAGDLTQVTPAHAWTVDAMASAHLCIAAQIGGPSDAFAPPSLNGLAVGPSDPLILIDNNKAQRNLQDTVGTGSGTEMFAVIANAERRPRAMSVGIRIPPDAAAVSGRVSIVGGESIDLRQAREAVLRVGELGPGERRWLKFSVVPQSEKPVMVDFFDRAPTARSNVVNGFTIQFARAEVPEVATRNLRAWIDVLRRLSVLQKNEAAAREAENAQRFLARGRLTADAYVTYLGSRRQAIERLVASHLKTAGGDDPFEISNARKSIAETARAKNADALATAHNALNERLDAHLTQLVKK